MSKHYVDPNNATREADSNAADLIAKNFSVQTDADGKQRVVGIEVNPAFAPFVNFLYQFGIAPLTNAISGKVYKHSSTLAANHFFKGDANAAVKAHKFGSAAEIVTVIGMLGLDPIMKILGTSWDYRKARAKLYDEFRPVIENTGADSRHNEVMKVEYNRIYHDAIDDAKGILPKLPHLIVEGAYVYYAKRDEAAKRGKQIASGTLGAAGGEAAMEQLLKKEADAERAVMNARKKFIEDHIEPDRIEDEDRRARIGEVFDNGAGKRMLERLLGGLESDLETAKKTNPGFFENLLTNHRNETIAGSAALTESLQVYLRHKDNKKRNNEHPTAWRMIQGLKAEVEVINARQNENGICGLNTIDPSQIEGRIKKIFEQHEIDMGRGKLTGAPNLRALDEASHLIAKAIAKDGLDALALVNLVGEHMVLVTKDKHRVVAPKQSIEEKIDKLKQKIGACAVPSAQEFYDHFENAKETKEQLKNYLNKMPDGIEKDCFASIFSYDVLKDAGWDKKDAMAAHARAKEHMHDVVERSIKEIALKSEDELKKYNLTENDLRALEQIANVFENGSRKERETVIKSLVDGQGHALLQNILGAVALKELETDKNAWANRVKDKAPVEAKGGDGAEVPDTYGHTRRNLNGYAGDMKPRAGEYSKPQPKPESSGIGMEP